MTWPIKLNAFYRHISHSSGIIITKGKHVHTIKPNFPNLYVRSQQIQAHFWFNDFFLWLVVETAEVRQLSVVFEIDSITLPE